MTQSEVPRRVKPERGRESRAGALSIGAFEESRWRLRRTRAAMGIQSVRRRLELAVWCRGG